MAAFTTSQYRTPRISATKNAAAPMIGGMICPPVEAVASTAPANSASYPMRFIRGMVNVPVPITLAQAEPEMEPNSAEATTATFAGPPRKMPNTEDANSVI